MKCNLCTKDCLSLDSHHSIPQAVTGGKNSTQLTLCPTCHDSLHKAGTKLLSGDSTYADIFVALLPVSTKRLARELINSIFVALLRKREKVKPTDTFKITLEFPMYLNQPLKCLAKDNKLSVVNFIKNLVEEQLLSTYPVLRKIGDNMNED